MKYRTRTFYADKQKSEMWDRRPRGESMSSIGRHFNRASSSTFPHLAQFGGIRPAARKRSRFALSLTEREEISRGLVAKHSLRPIAKGLNRSPSTICREVRRNGGRQAYRAARSDQRAWDCATRPKPCQHDFPSDEELTNVCCAGDGFVYVVSSKGHLWRGKGDTWEQLSGERNSRWIDIVWFNNQLLLSSEFGLYQLRNDEVVGVDAPARVTRYNGALSISPDNTLLLSAGNGGASLYDGTEWTVLFERP